LGLTVHAADPPDLLVVVAYGLLLPQWLLDWPRRGCVNVHASLLPRWRGAAPIQHALMAGDRETGISIMRMTRRLDAGPVYRQRRLSIGERETAGELAARLALLGGEALADSLADILAGTAPAQAQDEAAATYAPKLLKQDAPIDWTQPADVLQRRVRAFNPWPVCEACLSDGRRLRIWRAQAQPARQRLAPGTIAAFGPDGIDVATGAGRLRLQVIQAPGSRPMEVRDYLSAHRVEDVSFVC
jgi:methionyl-tRNA formyltransferase